jgi:spastic paraplegia protein 7
MLCAKAVKVLAGGGQGQVLARLGVQGRAGLRGVHVRNYLVEARATKRMIERSGLGVSSLERMCGVRMIHTGNSRRQKEDGQKNDDEKERMISALKTAIGFFFVPLLLLLVFSGSGGGGGGRSDTVTGLDRAQRPGQPIGEIQWNDFYQNLLLKGEVQEIVIHSGVNRATAILHPGAVYQGKVLNTTVVRLVTPQVENMESRIREAEKIMGIKQGDGISVTYERRSESMGRVFGMLLIAAILVMMFKGMGAMSKNVRSQIGGANPFSKMGKADFTLIDPLNRKGKGTKFSDVAGLKEPKVEVLEFVDCLKNPDKYVELGAKPPKGAILFGPPGCGKTMLAKAVANEANVPFLSMNGSEFIEMIGGLGASRVRNLFAEARKRAPSIIYIDEIDAIGKKRNEGQGAGMGNQEGDQTLNQLLVEMDGMGSTSNVILMASTNRADVLDKALLRPGRFDRHITIDLPTVIERKEILEKHLESVVLEHEKTRYSERLATLTPGFSGADLANLVNEAALHAARDLQDKIKDHNLEYAIERVTAGPEKKTRMVSPQERRVVAYHESGHALVGWMLQHTDALLKVTIIPRTSAALGFAQYTPVDKKLFSPEELNDRMCMALGGRVAESLTFNKITTGAQNDLEKVTKMAYSQIRDFGFNEAVGQVSFEMGQGKKPYSKKLAATIDLEARKLIAQAYKRTEGVLQENQDKLEILAQKLLEVETLNYNDVEALLGPPPFGKKSLVSLVDYEQGLRQQSKLGEEGQGMGSGT